MSNLYSYPVTGPCVLSMPGGIKSLEWPAMLTETQCRREDVRVGDEILVRVARGAPCRRSQHRGDRVGDVHRRLAPRVRFRCPRDRSQSAGTSRGAGADGATAGTSRGARADGATARLQRTQRAAPTAAVRAARARDVRIGAWRNSTRSARSCSASLRRSGSHRGPASRIPPRSGLGAFLAAQARRAEAQVRRGRTRREGPQRGGAARLRTPRAAPVAAVQAARARDVRIGA